MFSTPNFRIHSQENENVTARKVNLVTDSVTRKAFTDRSVNQTSLKKNQFPKKSKLGETKTPKLIPDVLKYPDWLLDTCSYKEVEDTYEDVLSSNWRLTKKDVSNFNKAQTKTLNRKPQPTLNEIKLPEMEIDPFVLDLPMPLEKVVLDFVEEKELPMPTMFDFDY